MRIAVLSDIHSNLVALDAVLAHVGPVDAVWHLGDVVGYGPDPDGVVARLAEIGALGVLGNHDAAALGGPEIEWFNPEAKAAVAWTRDTSSAATQAWLAEQPRTTVLESVALVHGSLREPLREYITSRDVARANLALQTTSIGLHGHTHVPAAFVRTAAGIDLVAPKDGTTMSLAVDRALLNPGSVGQPRDGDPAASYLVLDTDLDLATWHRVAYDIGAVQAAMRAVRLPSRLIDRLSFGV
ncbi:MAG: metallophosphoesterase family protein [Candidatus Limnocylindrales bacterium]